MNDFYFFMSMSQSGKNMHELLKYRGTQPASLVSGGMESALPLIPENVIVRVDSNSTVIPKETYVHRRMILKTILSGKLNALIDGLSFPLTAGDSVLFFPFQFHSSVDEENTPKHSFIAISFLMPENNFSPLLPLKNRVLKLSDHDIAALKKIAGAFYNEPGAVSHSQAVLLLTEILLHQLENSACTTAENAASAEIRRAAGHHEIFDFIRHNFDQKISLKSLAAEFDRSPESIRKIFHQYFPGLTPGKLIAKLQIQKAVELLENSDSSIGDIAEKCGFADTFTFSKKFKKVTGLSPRDYRREQHSRD